MYTLETIEVSILRGPLCICVLLAREKKTGESVTPTPAAHPHSTSLPTTASSGRYWPDSAGVGMQALTWLLLACR